MISNVLVSIAQASSPAGASAGGGFNIGSFIPIICIVVIFYFLAIRPQSQRQKQQDALIRAVKSGDRIITSSGIHGLVSNVKETTLILKIADNVKIEIEKSSISSVVKRSDEDAAAPAAAS